MNLIYSNDIKDEQDWRTVTREQVIASGGKSILLAYNNSLDKGKYYLLTSHC